MRTWNSIFSEINRRAWASIRSGKCKVWKDAWHNGFFLVLGFWYHESVSDAVVDSDDRPSTIEEFAKFRNRSCSRCALRTRGSGCKRLTGLKMSLGSHDILTAYVLANRDLEMGADGISCSAARVPVALQKQNTAIRRVRGGGNEDWERVAQIA